MMKWLEQFNENYYGRSEQAKELEKFSKSTFKGNVYIPWAVMERMVYQQDPTAVFTKGRNDSLVISEKVMVRTEIKGDVTYVEGYAHFVIVCLSFLGRHFEEHYPIQDTAYDAPKIFDQNMVNKALQRALAKVASRGTGLGLSLYENGELQFEEDKTVKPTPTPKKSIVVKTQEALKEMPIVETSVSTLVAELPDQASDPLPETFMTDDIHKIISLIRKEGAGDKVKNALRSFNPSFVKRYGVSLSLEDTDDELRDKLGKLEDPSKFYTSLERMSQ